jgi:hypothetical protein
MLNFRERTLTDNKLIVVIVGADAEQTADKIGPILAM